MKTPRPHQIKVIADLRDAMRTHRRVLVCLPTGAGKTLVAGELVRGAAYKGAGTLTIAHREELIKQLTAAICEQAGIAPAQVWQYGCRYDGAHTVGMVATLANAAPLTQAPRLIIIDEAHHAIAATYRKVLDKYPDAFVVGLTATPERLDGRGLGTAHGGIFDALVVGTTVAELQDLGLLCRARYFAPQSADNGLASEPLKWWRMYADGLPTIAFSPTVAEAQELAQVFCDAGVSAVAVSGDSPYEVRAQSVADYAAGRITVICNCNLFGEGVDVPATACVLVQRNTKSLALWLQMIGRALRPAPNKKGAIIIDLGRNCEQHGLAHEARDWSLAGKKGRTLKAAKGVTCAKCFAYYLPPTPATPCPCCGYTPMVKPKKRKKAKANTSPVVEFKAADGSKVRVGRAQYEELVKTAALKGYKKGWVYYQIMKMSGKQTPR